MIRLNGLEKTVSALLLSCGSFFMIFPFFWMLTTALKKEENVMVFPPVLIPFPPQWDNFIQAWTSAPFTQFLFNSLFVALTTTLLGVFFSSLAGYAFAKLRFPGRRFVFFLLLSTLMIPGQITMIPVYLLLRDLGLLNSLWGLIALGISSGFGVFLMRQFMQNISDELIQAARIDGCGEFRLFFRVILPLIQPAIATLSIFIFLGTWDNFFWPLILLDSESTFTLPLGLARFQGQYTVDIRMIMAVSLIMTIPVFLFFVFFQKNFVQGMDLTSVKGG